MSVLIKDMQKKVKKEEIIDNLLKQGIEPTIKQVNQLVNDYEYNHILGVPLFRGFNIQPHSISNKEKWNSNFYNLEKDLNLSYRAINEIKEKFKENENILDQYREDIIKRLLNLKNNNDNLNNILNKNYISYSTTFIPNDLYNVELDGNNINLPPTSSFIDLKYTRIINNKISNSDKVNIENSNIKITSNCKKSNEYGSVNDILKDDNNKYTLYLINEDNKCYININVTLKRTEICSTVSIFVDTINGVSGTLTLYLSNGDIVTMEAEKINSAYEWSFNQCEISSFNIRLNKNSIDGVNSNNINNFIFNIKNISIFNEYYKDSSTFTSGKNTVNKIFGEVKISPKEDIPVGTNIVYMAGINNNDDLITWYLLNKDQFVDIGLLNINKQILNNGVLNFGNKNNQLYYIGKVKDYINNNSVSLYSGYQQWLCSTLKSEEFNKDYIINIDSYNKSKVIDETYIDYETYDFTMTTNKLIILTTNVTCNNDYIDEDNFINLVDSNLELQNVLYVNNKNIVRQSNGKYNIPFNKGKNKIILLLYIGSDTEKEVKLEFNFNFKKVSKNIYCGNKMKQIDMSTLKSLIPTNKYYCIDNNNIYVNFNPIIKSKYFKPLCLLDINTYEENSNYINYEGTWNSVTPTTETKIQGKYTTTPNENIIFKFKGTGLTLYNKSSLKRGICVVDIDGKQWCIDTAACEEETYHPFFNIDNLSDTEHTCIITVKDRNNTISTTNDLDLSTFINIDKVTYTNNKITCTSENVTLKNSFIGSKIRIYGNKGDYGTVRFIIDGIVYSVDCYSTTETTDELLLNIDTLQQGTHELEIELNETSSIKKFVISNINITNDNTSTINEYEMNNDNIILTGSYTQTENEINLNTKESSISFIFEGTGVELWSKFSNTDYSLVKIFLDENLIDTINTKSTDGITNKPIVKMNNLDMTTHQIKIVLDNDKTLNLYSLKIINGILLNNRISSLNSNLFYINRILVKGDNETISGVLTNGTYNIDYTNTGILYSDNWLDDITGIYNNCTIRQTDILNNKATFSFYGNKIKIYGYKDNVYGKMEINIDGQVSIIDLYNNQKMFNQILFEKDLSKGVHKVKITCLHVKNNNSLGYNIQFDKIELNGLMLKDVNYQDYCRFKLQYKSLKKEYIDKFIDNKGNINIDLRIMAILQSEDNTITPQLFSYTLETR